MRQSGAQSKAMTIIKTVVTVLFMFALFFIPAGTLNWPEAWLFIVFYLTAVTGLMIWMKKKAPGLLKERMSRKKEAKSWDRKFLIAYCLVLIVFLIIPGLDAVRFHWSEVPLILKVLGFIGYIPGLGFAFWAMKENAYASDVVRIQEDRGHTVCTTGPYRHVRHPMYVGVILFLFCFPLSLGSLYTFIPSSIIIILFIIRTSLEDRALQEELPGYKEYSQKVRYRLLPGVW
ncbi:MAG: isoprenylcysteine carboxylmethyltransferase family protein [Candidatus Aminicenantes bacterium]|nr:isoprenylcysteine carboxylmethyltransferase family protein [Candidatus Aminicenantes bacterium]MDH5706434.1 isoprenylcysteine carboxylmethyltransferase family protein [Candidatus Aminicenantes bacterium]